MVYAWYRAVPLIRDGPTHRIASSGADVHFSCLRIAATPPSLPNVGLRYVRLAHRELQNDEQDQVLLPAGNLPKACETPVLARFIFH